MVGREGFEPSTIGLKVLEFKGKTLIATHPDGPAPLQLALQWMQFETRDIHILDGVRGIQSGELKTKPVRMRGPYPRCAAGFMESAQACVANRPYHQSSIAACCATRNFYSRVSSSDVTPSCVAMAPRDAYRAQVLAAIIRL
jgi:hypothetical protein